MHSHRNRLLAALSTALLMIFGLTLIVLRTNFGRPAFASDTSSRRQTLPKALTVPMPMSPMTLVAPLFVEDAQTSSTITMVNSLPAPIDLDLVLYDLSGNQITKRTMTIGANAAQQLAVRGLLDAASYGGPAYGSAILMPHRMVPMAAQLSMVRRNGLLDDIEEEFAMQMEQPAPANFRSVASSVAAAPVVAVRSLSKTQRTVTIECLRDGEQQSRSAIQVEPNQTLLVQACVDEGAKEVASLDDVTVSSEIRHPNIGISVSSAASSMELAVFGIAAVGGNSDHNLRGMQFTDVNALKSSTAIYPGAAAESSLLGLQNPKFRLAMANFGNSMKDATILLTKGRDAASTEQQVAVVQLPPGKVVVRSLDSETLLGGSAPDSSLVVQTDAAIGDVLTDVQVLSASSALSIPLPWKDQEQIFNGGQHPWRTDGDFSSTVLLFNPDLHDTNSAALFIYSNGKVWNKTFVVSPLATVPVQINEIITSQERDGKGRTLPKTATSGIVSWFTLRKPKIFGQLVQASPAEGVARPFACPMVTVVCGGTIDPAGLAVGQQQTVNGNALVCGACAGTCQCALTCDTFGDPDNGPAVFSSWGSSNTTVATFVSSPTDGSAIYQGQSAGSALSGAFVEDSNNCGSRIQGTISVYSVAITGADLENNSVTINTGGPTGDTDVLTITANGSSHNVQVSANNGNAVGPGSYTVSFNRPSIPADTYTTVTAAWHGASNTFTLSRQWTVLGLYRHTQYNTPNESACTGTATTAWVFTASCTWTQTTLRSDFVSQVAGNGSGVSLNYGALHYEPTTVCSANRPQGSNDQNSFEQITSVTGSCNTAVSGGYSGTVAVNPNPAIVGGPYVCGDNILEVTASNTNEALKTSQDYCPVCNDPTTWNGTNGHIDDYSSLVYCSARAVGDLGNFWTADTH